MKKLIGILLLVGVGVYFIAKWISAQAAKVSAGLANSLHSGIDSFGHGLASGAVSTGIHEIEGMFQHMGQGGNAPVAPDYAAGQRVSDNVPSSGTPADSALSDLTSKIDSMNVNLTM